jgi:Family of unknown function (DUF6152)
MKAKPAACFLILAGLLAGSVSAFAHHGTVAYDPGAKVTLKGTIANFEWRNPHTQIHLDVAGDKGSVVHWNFEAQPPNILIHAGWTKETLKPGDQVTIIASPAKNGAPVGIIQKVVLASGEELTMTEK